MYLKHARESLDYDYYSNAETLIDGWKAHLLRSIWGKEAPPSSARVAAKVTNAPRFFLLTWAPRIGRNQMPLGPLQTMHVENAF